MYSMFKRIYRRASIFVSNCMDDSSDMTGYNSDESSLYTPQSTSTSLSSVSTGSPYPFDHLSRYRYEAEKTPDRIVYHIAEQLDTRVQLSPIALDGLSYVIPVATYLDDYSTDITLTELEIASQPSDPIDIANVYNYARIAAELASQNKHNNIAAPIQRSKSVPVITAQETLPIPPVKHSLSTGDISNSSMPILSFMKELRGETNASPSSTTSEGISVFNYSPEGQPRKLRNRRGTFYDTVLGGDDPAHLSLDETDDAMTAFVKMNMII